MGQVLGCRDVCPSDDEYSGYVTCMLAYEKQSSQCELSVQRPDGDIFVICPHGAQRRPVVPRHQLGVASGRVRPGGRGAEAVGGNTAAGLGGRVSRNGTGTEVKDCVGGSSAGRNGRGSTPGGGRWRRLVRDRGLMARATAFLAWLQGC